MLWDENSKKKCAEIRSLFRLRWFGMLLFYGNKADNKTVGSPSVCAWVPCWTNNKDNSRFLIVERTGWKATTTTWDWEMKEEKERGVGHVSRSVSSCLSTSESAILVHDGSEMLVRVTCVGKVSLGIARTHFTHTCALHTHTHLGYTACI